MDFEKDLEWLSKVGFGEKIHNRIDILLMVYVFFNSRLVNVLYVHFIEYNAVPQVTILGSL